MVGTGMEDFLKQRLANQLASGELILFTGAGFSRDATNQIGSPIPGVRQVSEVLWAIAFPGTPFDAYSTLGDIYQVAEKRAGNKVKEALRELLIVDATLIPEVYRKWFSMPWFRIYTLNVDDLDEGVDRVFELPRRLKSLSAQKDSYPGDSGELLSIHLNGRIEDYPSMTFSPRQYAERAVRQDPWYSHLIADLTSHPVVFVGTELNEPLLWQHMEMRGRKTARQRELRPGSYLVTPSISAARAAMLDEFNIKLVSMGHAEFVATVLDSMEVERQAGLKKISSRLSAKVGGQFLFRVADLRTQKDDGSGQFLLGREPYWSDITSGLAVEREFESKLKEELEQDNERIVILTGTAGSGKSTTIMRLALEYHASGKQVGWLNSEVDLPLWQVKEAVHSAGLDVVAIDDADNFGHQVGPLITELSSENPDMLVVAAMRSTKFDRLQVGEYLSRTPHRVYALPTWKILTSTSFSML